MRYWGSAQELPKNSQPVFIIPWRPKPRQELLLDAQQAQRTESYEMHHIFPREFKKWFGLKGIDIDQYTLPLEVEEHRSLHKGALGGPWNAVWREWILKNNGAQQPDIHQFAGKLIYDFGLFGRIVPYRPRTSPLPITGY